MIERLLADVSAIGKKYALINQKTGAYFNIFDIVDRTTDEVFICKFLYELLNPKGLHYQGSAYLKLFIRDVLQMDLSEQELDTARVYKEYALSSGRRIDLLIVTTNHKIPIEVKIFAGDQNRQCYDYSKYAHDSKVFYLTLYGDLPSAASAKGLTPVIDDDGEILGYEEVSLLSFSIDIRRWIDICTQLPETIRIAPIREILLQFKDALCKLTGQMEGGAKMDIVKTISASTDTIKSALDIEKALPEVKSTILSNFYNEIKRLFEEKGNVLTTTGFGSPEDYFVTSRQAGFGFYIELAKMKKTTAIFVVELYHCLFFGFSLIDNASGKFLEIREVEKKYNNEYTSLSEAISSVISNIKRWPKVLYVNLTDSSGQEYDFKNFSLPCVDLADNYTDEAKRIFTLLDGYCRVVKKKMNANVK